MHDLHHVSVIPVCCSLAANIAVTVQVMGVNGVSHHIVEDDLAGCTAALHWLAYVPAVLGSLPPTLPSSDPIGRAISYAPGPSEFFLYSS